MVLRGVGFWKIEWVVGGRFGNLLGKMFKVGGMVGIKILCEYGVYLGKCW